MDQPSSFQRSWRSTIFAALAEFEREIIRECTNAGLASARARGNVGGRKKALSDAQVKMLVQMAGDKTLSVADICLQFGISKASYDNYLRKRA